MNLLGPQHYALLETADQLRVLCGVLNKKEIDSLGMDESRFITCGDSELKAYNGHLHKLRNNKAKVGALNLRKHLGPWQSQKKLVDSHSNGWTYQVWDPGKSYKNQHFWRVIACIGAFRNLLNMNWDPIENMKFKHWHNLTWFPSYELFNSHMASKGKAPAKAPSTRVRGRQEDHERFGGAILHTWCTEDRAHFKCGVVRLRNFPK
ncbi:hypothetical protein PIB30_092539 [Stylosanthes scabra]|uniref:Uncharacterized protein n=1 Tax=Stylosanthes scabra TaxID=79078 RepID=A0ABU6SX90_9FABA|nr:hypothetical protein [Stylosanthes scabra]